MNPSTLDAIVYFGSLAYVCGLVGFTVYYMHDIYVLHGWEELNELSQKEVGITLDRKQVTALMFLIALTWPLTVVMGLRRAFLYWRESRSGASDV